MIKGATLKSQILTLHSALNVKLKPCAWEKSCLAMNGFAQVDSYLTTATRQLVSLAFSPMRSARLASTNSNV